MADALAIVSILMPSIGPMAQALKQLQQDAKDFGIVLAFVLLFLTEARSVVHRVRVHITADGDNGLEQAQSMKQSYTPTLAMIGVAGAIIAQIALTALTLPDLQSIHWTAQGSFVICLVCGTLSVFCSCVLQGTLSGLHSPQKFFEWITARPDKATAQLLDAYGQIQQNIELSTRDTKRLARALEGRRLRPSIAAALALTAPIQLLRIALMALFVGLGMYFGFVYSNQLPTSGGDNSALAILVTYVVVVSLGLFSFFVPLNQDLTSTYRGWDLLQISVRMDRMAAALHEIDTELLDERDNASVSAKDDGNSNVVNIMNELIRLQKEQLVQQQQLMKAMSETLVTPRPHAKGKPYMASTAEEVPVLSTPVTPPSRST